MIENKPKLKVALLMNKAMYERILHPDDLIFLKSFADIVNVKPCPDALDENFMKEAIQGADVCITSWGTPKLTKEVLDMAPELKMIAHTAGTPRAIVIDEVWDRKIRVFTAAPVIAIDVAETVLGAMIFSLKCLWQYNSMVHSGEWSRNKEVVSKQLDYMKRLNYRLTVGIVSASHVGRNLIRILKPFGVKINLYDPYITDFQASELGVNRVSIEEIMANSDVVSIHAPNLPETYHMINKDLLALMKTGTLFMNTARGPIVDQDALIAELKTGRINAYLDVYDKEPLPEDSELLKLDNVILSPHISGGHSINGRYELGNYIVQQLYSYYTKGILENEVKKDIMKVIA